MTATAALLAFTLAAAILTVTPGMDSALVLRTAAVEGSRRALMAGLGVAAGCLLWGAVAALGLGSLLLVSTLAYDALRICAALYLFYLGVKLLWGTLPGKQAAHGAARPAPVTMSRPSSSPPTTLPPPGRSTGVAKGWCRSPAAIRASARWRSAAASTS